MRYVYSARDDDDDDDDDEGDQLSIVSIVVDVRDGRDVADAPTQLTWSATRTRHILIIVIA